jgi:hypothetical protein
MMATKFKDMYVKIQTVEKAFFQPTLGIESNLLA